MSEANEFQELHESANHGHGSSKLAPVSFTMAILAVLVATVTLLGHRSHTEEILLQNRTTDQWAYYQAKNLRRNNLEALNDVLGALESKDDTKAEKVQQRFEHDIDKYGKEQKDIEREARGLEDELGHVTRRADRFDLGEVLLEIALVITSITLLTGRRAFWLLGMLFGTAGVIVALTAYFLH